MAKKTGKRVQQTIPEDTSEGLRSLSSELRNLTGVVSKLQNVFQTFNAGNLDAAKVTAESVQNTETLKKNYKSLVELLNSNVKKSNEFNLVAKSIVNIQEFHAQILAEQAKLDAEKTLDLKEQSGISARYTDLLIQQQILGQKITALQNEKSKLIGDELKEAEELLDFAIQEQSNIQKVLKAEQDLAALLKARIKEAEKKKIIDEATLNVNNKLTEVLGTQGEELIEIGHAIKHSMISPLALVGALIGNALEEFGKINRESRAFLDTSKLTVDQTEHLRHYAHDLSLEYRAQGVEMKDVLDSTNALVGQFGSLNRVSDKAVEKATLLGKSFGISADNAAGVMAQLQRSTGASAETAGNIAALGANFAKAAGVAPDAVMQDIASSSEEIAKYFKGTPKDLFKAAVEARRLGLDLKKVAGISQSLLNFESSIEDQMTASVLLGREINLDKARQLAMEGKLEDAAKETLSQVGSLADFNKMNAVQKEAIAKAAGLTVGDLQKSLEAQEAIKNMTVAQRTEYEKGLKALNDGNESAADRLLKEQRNQLTQEKIADAVAKISELFANVILPVLEPIFDFVSFIFDKFSWIFKVAKYALTVFVGWKAILLSIRAISSTIDFFKGLNKNSVGKGLAATRDGIKGIGTLMKEQLKSAWSGSEKESTSVLDTIKNKFKELFASAAASKEQSAPTEVAGGGSDVVSTIQDKAKEKGGELIDSVTGKTDEAVDAEKKMASSPGKGIKNFLTNMSEGLRSMASKEIRQGAANLAVAGGAFIVFTLALPGLAVVSAGKLIEPGLKGLANGISAMGTVGVKKGALGLALVGLSIIPAALAFSMLKDLDTDSIIIFTLALSGLATMATILGNFAPQLILGAIGIGILGAALIPAAIAFKLIEGLDSNSIITFGIAIGSFAVGAALLGTIAPLIIAGSYAIGTLGLALIPFGVALAIAAPALQTVSTSLQTLIANVTGEQLLSVGAGLLSIGAGLAAIGVGGVMALPALLGLAAIAPALATISSIFGGEEAGGATAAAEGGEGTGLNEVITKLDSLISAINNQPIQLVVNGKTLAEVVGRGTTRSGAATNK